MSLPTTLPTEAEILTLVRSKTHRPSPNGPPWYVRWERVILNTYPALQKVPHLLAGAVYLVPGRRDGDPSTLLSVTCYSTGRHVEWCEGWLMEVDSGVVAPAFQGCL